jgi:hypothetical protein
MLLALFVLFSVASAQTQSQCTAFCDDYNTTCMGLAAGNDIYSTMQTCIDECMHYPMDSNCPNGDITQAAVCGSGNSYGCRRYHLNVAKSNASDPSVAMTHCPHTTPLSSPSLSLTAADALTGTVCKSMINATMTGLVPQNGLLADFCNQVTTTCSAYLNGISLTACSQFYTNSGALTDLSNYPDGVTRKFPIQGPATPSGNNLACRRYHIYVARTAGNAQEHCPHALFGAGSCGTNCEVYCAMGRAICPSQFTTDCETQCATLPAVTDYVMTSNKDVVCRMYHLSVAAQGASQNADHCPHTSIVSTAATCGSASTASFSALLVAALALITKFAS